MIDLHNMLKMKLMPNFVAKAIKTAFYVAFNINQGSTQNKTCPRQFMRSSILKMC